MPPPDGDKHLYQRRLRLVRGLRARHPPGLPQRRPVQKPPALGKNCARIELTSGWSEVSWRA